MKRLIPLLVLVLFAACQSDDEHLVPATEGGAITFGSVVTGGVGWANGRGTTRPVTPKVAGDMIDAVTPANMGVFAFGDKQGSTTVFDNQKVLFIDSTEYTSNPFPWDYWDKANNTGLSRWPYYTGDSNEPQRLWQKMKYRFMAYSPYSASGVSVVENNYNFNIFTWLDIPEYSDRDYIIAKEIQSVDNSKGTVKKEDVVTFQMKHIMARIRLLFKISAGYREIRRIEIDSVTVHTGGLQRNAAFAWGEARTGAPDSVTLISETGLVYDVPTSYGDARTGAPDSVTLISETGLVYDVPTSYGDAFSSVYVWPQSGFRQMTLTVNYSTFDSKNVKTREAEITNTVTMSPVWTLQAGYYYDVKIYIAPDYLYVLSDNDQEFDGYVIIKEHNP